MSSKPSKCEEENQKKVEITKTPRKFDEKKLKEIINKNIKNTLAKSLQNK